MAKAIAFLPFLVVALIGCESCAVDPSRDKGQRSTDRRDCGPSSPRVKRMSGALEALHFGWESVASGKRADTNEYFRLELAGEFELDKLSLIAVKLDSGIGACSAGGADEVTFALGSEPKAIVARPQQELGAGCLYELSLFSNQAPEQCVIRTQQFRVEVEPASTPIERELELRGNGEVATRDGIVTPRAEALVRYLPAWGLDPARYELRPQHSSLRSTLRRGREQRSYQLFDRGVAINGNAIVFSDGDVFRSAIGSFDELPPVTTSVVPQYTNTEAVQAFNGGSTPSERSPLTTELWLVRKRLPGGDAGFILMWKISSGSRIIGHVDANTGDVLYRAPDGIPK